jgi:hypothetical protein
MKELDSTLRQVLRSGLAKLTGSKRRSFAGEICDTYYGGNPRKMERLLGGCRHMIYQGQQENKTGIVCLSDYSKVGRKKKSIPILTYPPI